MVTTKFESLPGRSGRVVLGIVVMVVVHVVAVVVQHAVSMVLVAVCRNCVQRQRVGGHLAHLRQSVQHLPPQLRRLVASVRCVLTVVEVVSVVVVVVVHTALLPEMDAQCFGARGIIARGLRSRRTARFGGTSTAAVTTLQQNLQKIELFSLLEFFKQNLGTIYTHFPFIKYQI